MYIFLEVCEAVIVYTLLNVLIISNHRKHPPFIEKGEKGKKNPECYIVSAWYQLGRGGGYHQYKFVKRKNGKYRLKFYPVLECLGGGLFLRFYIWVVKWDLLLKYPETLILPSLALLLVLLDLFLVVDNAPIVARIYFHKYMKTHIKGKRR